MNSSHEPERPWERWLVHLLWAVSVRTSTLGEAALADSPVTLAGCGFLENVNASPGITIAEIARVAPQTQQALSQIAARLESQDFIDRRLAGRGRGVALHLTPAGETALRDARAMAESFEAELEAALGAERREHLVALLVEMRTIVGELQPARRPARPPVRAARVGELTSESETTAGR